MQKTLAIVGAGPAGLRAAEVAAEAGVRVRVWDAKPSAGRKFLVAGRGGLNLSKEEPPERFATRYESPGRALDFWRGLIAEFDTARMREWAASLGVETFAASTGRVYPVSLKAAPLLRQWLRKLRSLGVVFSMNHRLVGFGVSGDGRWRLKFDGPGGAVEEVADAVVFAMGGGSWPGTGSDGAWVRVFRDAGLRCAPLQPANCGWECGWPREILARVEGRPLKAVRVRAGEESVWGELLVTRYGLEGGALYQLGPELRRMREPRIWVDFKPHSEAERLVEKLGPVSGPILAVARRRLRLSEEIAALLEAEFTVPFAGHERALVARVKAFPVLLQRPRPLEEAISSAGGLSFEEVDETLMVRRLPGLFVAGEMLDWEAPTGGYLMQGCFALGGRAARGALQWMGLGG